MPFVILDLICTVNNMNCPNVAKLQADFQKDFHGFLIFESAISCDLRFGIVFCLKLAD